ncbi:MAG TPA: glucose 1-dehydrogenase [Nitriliruptorales bacterium]
MGRFTGRVAIVTGSSSGIGEAVARRLAAEGARVVVNSVTSTEAGERLAAELPDAVYVQADVSDEAACAGLVRAAVDRYGGLDLLVNNAGWTQVIAHGDLDAVTDQVWRRILDTNVLGAWYMTRAAVPALRDAEDGNVVNVSSVAGVRPSGSSIPYAVSKAALNHMTRLLASALGPDVRVNAVAPGLIATPWTEDWDAIHAYVAERAPLRRSGRPDDVAEVCLGLAMSRYVTGEVVVVDGGVHLLVG